jgi:hypothetical protein
MKIVVYPFKWDIKRVYNLSQAVWNRYNNNGFVISLTYILTFINFTRKHSKNIFVGKRKRKKNINSARMKYIEKNWYNTKYKISKKLKNIFQFLRFSMIYIREKKVVKMSNVR